MVAGRLELKAPGDGLGFRVPEGARPRRLEIRIAGRGTGTLGLGASDFGKETSWRERAISGSFRVKLPYYHLESGGPDLRVTLRSAGADRVIQSVASFPRRSRTTFSACPESRQKCVSPAASGRGPAVRRSVPESVGGSTTRPWSAPPFCSRSTTISPPEG